MGSLSYDGWVVRFDDRTLSHLQIVIIQQLRRGQSFAMSWLDSVESGSGRSSIWLHPQGNLHFKFDENSFPSINQDWLDQLSASAVSAQGLIVTGEDGGLVHSEATTRRLKGDDIG